MQGWLAVAVAGMVATGASGAPVAAQPAGAVMRAGRGDPPAAGAARGWSVAVPADAPPAEASGRGWSAGGVAGGGADGRAGDRPAGNGAHRGVPTGPRGRARPPRSPYSPNHPRGPRRGPWLDAHHGTVLLWPYGFSGGWLGGVAVPDAPDPLADVGAARPVEPLVVGSGGPATSERRVGRTRVIEVGVAGAPADTGLRVATVGDSLLRLSWGGRAAEVSFVTTDATRRPITTQTAHAAPYVAVLPITAAVAYAGVTTVGGDGVTTTRLVPVRQAVGPRGAP